MNFVAVLVGSALVIAAKGNRYVSIEGDFTDGVSSGKSVPSRYQQILTAAAIETLARQIVAAIVEFLLDPQANLDLVTYNQKKPLGGLW